MFLLGQKNYGTSKENNKKVSIYTMVGLVQLRKAITLLDFIVANEAIESVKITYSEKQK